MECGTHTIYFWWNTEVIKMSPRRKDEDMTQSSKDVSYHRSRTKSINRRKALYLLLFLYLRFKETIISFLRYKLLLLLLDLPYTAGSGVGNS